jgi:hypothetical protein
MYFCGQKSEKHVVVFNITVINESSKRMKKSFVCHVGKCLYVKKVYIRTRKIIAAAISK